MPNGENAPQPQELSKKERREMKRMENERARSSASKKAAQKQYGVIAVVAFLLAGTGWWWWHYGPRPTAEAFDPTKVCTTDPRTVMHIHPHLAILIDGNEEKIPESIGVISPVCLRPLHTHASDGVIHVESPVVRDFTLGEFFRVWGKPFDQTHILDKVADETHRVVLTVDGNESQDYENLILRDNQRIVISYKAVEK